MKALTVKNRFYAEDVILLDPAKAAIAAACRAKATEQPSWIVREVSETVTNIYRVAPDGVVTDTRGQHLNIKA